MTKKTKVSIAFDLVTPCCIKEMDVGGRQEKGTLLHVPGKVGKRQSELVFGGQDVNPKL